MRLQRIRIPAFRNLRELDIAFDAHGQHAAGASADAPQPPKPFRVGAEVEPGVVLTSVGPRRAVLAPDLKAEPVATLELPPQSR